MDMKTLIYMMVGGILVCALAVPVMYNITMEPLINDTESNQWVRMGYIEDASEEYTFNVGVAGDTVTIGSMSGSSAIDTVVYSDDGGALMIAGGEVVYIYESGDDTAITTLGASVSVTNTAGQLTVSDGVNTVVRDSPAWAYCPQAGGNYACYDAGGLYVNNEPLSVGGYFGGVYAYNELITPDYGLVMDSDATNEYITSVNWVQGA